MFQIDLPRAVVGFVGVHLGLRAEAAHVERLRDAGDLAGARRRARLLATVLHHHHRAEDTVLFPALVARQPGVAVTTAELEAQHVELDVALGRLPTDLSTRPATCAGLVERHLGLEEQHVLPIWMASFDAAEHERFAGSLRRATPLRDAGLMIAWLLDTAPDGAVGVAWDQVPPALRARPPGVVAAALRALVRHDRPGGDAGRPAVRDGRLTRPHLGGIRTWAASSGPDGSAQDDPPRSVPTGRSSPGRDAVDATGELGAAEAGRVDVVASARRPRRRSSPSRRRWRCRAPRAPARSVVSNAADSSA